MKNMATIQAVVNKRIFILGFKLEIKKPGPLV
jgi:hypothetical protein